MKINYVFAVFFLCITILYSCISNNDARIIVPEFSEGQQDENIVLVEDIIETQSGYGNSNLPDWLRAYILGGIGEIEKMGSYRSKYCFVGRNEGINFEALAKWAENFSVEHNFTRLAALRIEKRIISSTTLYPDDEYGVFYERMIKKAFNAAYNDVIMQDTYWIKKTDASYNTVYEFFLLISIEKLSMQNAINKMMTEAREDAHLSRSQNNAVSRLQQAFFEGF
jgi:hypothetical protein